MSQPLEALLRYRERLLASRHPKDAVFAAALADIADHPQAADHPDVDLAEVLAELAECRANLQDFDGAIDALQAAVAAGCNHVPDARCDLAGYHLRAGRRDRAASLLEEVCQDTPDDVWLYNNAGIAYQDIQDDETALRWLTEGLERALDGDGPEKLIAQLADLRLLSLEALGGEAATP